MDSRTLLQQSKWLVFGDILLDCSYVRTLKLPACHIFIFRIEKVASRRKSGAIRMLEFGDLEDARDESMEPFKLGTIELKVNPKTNNKEVYISLPSPNSTPTPPSKEQTRNNKNVKRKSTSSDSEDSDCNANESPSKRFICSPSMPKLIPQVDLVPNKNPEKSKPAKFLKYTQDEEESQESISRPTTSTIKKLTVLEGTSSLSSSQGSSHRGSLHTDSSTVKPQMLPTTQEKKRTRKVRQVSGGSSSQYSGHSVSGDDNKSTNSSVAKSAVGRPRASKIITCEICGESGFRTPSQFTNHLEMHEGKRPYMCPICFLGYETDLKLLEHVSIRHTKEAMFKCNACGKDYKTESGLANHRCNLNR